MSTDIQAALALGITESELADPALRKQWLETTGESIIEAASEKYGPGSKEAQAAIDEANRQSVIVTNAAAELAREG